MQNIIKNILTDVKVELSAEFDQNFTRKAFFDKKWKDRKRQGKGVVSVTAYCNVQFLLFIYTSYVGFVKMWFLLPYLIRLYL